MPYIGNTVQNQGFTPAIDYFSGNGVTVTFTLTRPVSSVAQMIVAIDNVIQNPSSAFTVAGNAITFTSAPLSGTNNIWVEYTSLITTYAAISQDPTVIGDITTNGGGFLSTGDFGNAYLSGTIIDYVTGLGRVTVGPSEGIALYNGGTSARTALASWNSAGTLTNTGGAVIQGLTVGKGAGSGTNATAVGQNALAQQTSGDANAAFGRLTLYGTTTGGFNTAIGTYALYSNTTASLNTASGYQSMYTNTTGQYNAAYGANSLRTNNADANTAMGSSSMYSNTTGSGSVGIGTSALYANTTGANNVAIGYATLGANTTASNNTAVGYQALYASTTGQRSVAVGNQAGLAITTGSYNTFLGEQAGLAATTSSGNTFIGQGSGQTVTTGASNTILGRFSGNQGGLNISTASNYIVLSDGDGNPRINNDGVKWNIPAYNSTQYVTSSIGAGMSLTVRSQSTAGIYVENNDWGGATGIQINTLGTGTSDLRNIRFYAAGTLVGSITSTNTTTAYNTSSDYRLKENIQPMTGALATVAQLKPVTYDWKVGGSGQGFIAHELQAVVPDCVSGQKDAVDADGNPEYQGVDTSFLVATLVAAIQEQQAMIEELKTKVAALEAK